MRSGHETLTSIDQALRQVRRQGTDLDGHIQRVSGELLHLGQQEAEKYKALATVRLRDLAEGDLVPGLDEVERRVGELMAMRDAQLEELHGRIEESEQDKDGLQFDRADQAQRLAKATERLDKVEATTQERLQSKPEHMAQLARARTTDATAAQAELKTKQAETDRLEKGRPYESDPLFMYLWKRGYGTSRYASLPLLRFLDGKVADLCGYQAARPNYAMLLEIPVRLAEHAKRARETANEEFEALRTMEESAASEDGIPELREVVEQAERDLDAIDEQICEAEEWARGLVQQRADYAVGADELFRRAMDILDAEFRRDGIASLRREAMRTRTPQDDLLVQELADIADERDRLQDALAHHKQMYVRHIERLKDLERVRREFKQQRYDDAHSSFGNEQLILGILNEFLRGVASSGDLWGALRRHHRRRRIESDPDFGTGRSGGVWRLPSPRRGGEFEPRGGGGFHTGGGF